MAEKLWRSPEVGDTLTLPDGRVWKVTAVHERQRHQYRGEERVSYRYTDAAGSDRVASPMLREFISRMGRLAREGAVYERHPVTLAVKVPIVDALPDAARVGTLLACGGQVFAATEGGWLLVVPAELPIDGPAGG